MNGDDEMIARAMKRVKMPPQARKDRISVIKSQEALGEFVKMCIRNADEKKIESVEWRTVMRLRRYAENRRSSTYESWTHLTGQWIKLQGMNSVHVIDGGEEECPICLCQIEAGDGDEATVTGCRHLFHTSCINNWVKKRRGVACPMCRTCLYSFGYKRRQIFSYFKEYKVRSEKKKHRLEPGAA